ncbi:hypothetical protein [Thermomonospora umbrina]|uniref:Uncharacterized protein n=1 Tax=Thermomonospora umbrina TaxID=111806 RepID=A0A3D9T4E3_9ACTN|nr:hypothetical protein [Thermomonospora umbrina]REF00116.1 hypothetical protein DFJ69_5644 [Thermomonospora umbrina]
MTRHVWISSVAVVFLLAVQTATDSTPLLVVLVVAGLATFAAGIATAAARTRGPSADPPQDSDAARLDALEPLPPRTEGRGRA